MINPYKVLKKRANLAAACSWLHNKMAVYYHLIDRLLSFVVLILAAVITTLTAITVGTENTVIDGPAIKITSVVLSGLLGLVESSRKYYKFTATISNHRAAATNYSNLFNDIAKIFSTQDRNEIESISDEDLIKYLDKYNDAFKSSPHVWQLVIRQYIWQFGSKSGVSKSDLLGVQTLSKNRNNDDEDDRILVIVDKTLDPGQRLYELDCYFLPMSDEEAEVDEEAQPEKKSSKKKKRSKKSKESKKNAE